MNHGWIAFGFGLLISLSGVGTAQAQDPPVPKQAESESTRAYLGVGLSLVGDAQIEPGLVVVRVYPGSPADEAGLAPGDLLTRFDDQLLFHPRQVVGLVGSFNPGDEVEFQVVRDGQTHELGVVLAELPEALQAQLQPASQPLVWLGPDPRFDATELHALERMEGLHRQIEQQMQLLRQELNNIGPVDPLAAPDLRFMFDGLGTERLVLTTMDADHRITVTADETGRRVRVQDRHGEVLFEGPIDTADQIELLPDAARPKVEQMIERVPAPAVPAPAPGVA